MLLVGCGAKPEPTAPPPYQAQPTTPPEPPEPTTPPPPPTAVPSLIGTEAQPLVMVFVPSGDTQRILSGAEKLDKLIKDTTGLVTKSSVATSYAAVIEGMGAEKIDIGWLAPLSYVLAKDKYDAEVLLITLRYDSPTYKGQINVRADSGINTIADLKGKKFAFTDPVSTSGYLYPFALFKANGIDPTKDFAEAVFTGGHTGAVLAVYNGQVDASASYDDARGTLAATYPDIMDKVKVLTYTDPIPNDTVSVRAGLPEEVVAKFKQGMLDIAKTEEGKLILQEIYEIGGLTEGSDALFDPIRVVATGLGIELSNWKGASVKYLVGMVTDVGGVDDKSFNQTAYKGVTDAAAKMFVDGKVLESQQQSDYAKNIQEFLQQKADLIITVGFLIGVDTATFAKANPTTKFAIVDYAYPDCWPGAVVGKDCGSDAAIPNVRGLTFATDQAGFLAGYVAAAATKTGKVGTFGGMKLPTVTIFMVGYEAGVKYYNAQKGTNVQVLGWDTAKDDGLFTGNFESAEDGRRAAEALFDEGADIVMPVAGPCGLGAGAAAKERGLMVIGVDTDWYISAPEYKETYLTSVLKNMDTAVYDTISTMTKGTFKGGVNYVGTLANKGVAIAPFHDYESKVPATLADEIKAITADIIAGKIKW
jgi:basic membrane protein A